MRHALHPSLVVPNLVWGAERSLALGVLTTSAALVLGVGFKIDTMVIAVVLMTVGMGGLRLLAKYDPQFSWVYMRHLTYQDIYPAEGSVIPKNYPIRISVPGRADISGVKYW
jgi:type IV secretory pathway TrbD component